MKILIINIVANPFTLLSPKINKIKATINVVKLASIIVPIEFLFPFLKAVSKETPFNNSSLIRSKLITLESTAIPIPKITAAIPGNVNTPPTNQKVAKVNTV